MIKKSEEMRTEIRANMRGGNDEVTIVHILEKEDMIGKARFAARMTIPPGGSIGDHSHGPDAEIYIIVSGAARIDDNGTVHTLAAGDAVFTGGGEYHSCANAGDVPLEVIALIIE